MEAKSKKIQDAVNGTKMALKRIDEVAKRYLEEHERRVAANGGEKLPNRFENIEARLGVLTFGFERIKDVSEKSAECVNRLESIVESFAKKVEECEQSRVHDYEEIRRKDREIEQLKWQCRQQECAIEFLTGRMEELEKRLGIF